MKKDITELFVGADDFCKIYDESVKKHQVPHHGKRLYKTRIPGLRISEIMTILLLFQRSPIKNFKFFYLSYLPQYKSEFPRMPSYQRFIELVPRTLCYFGSFLKLLCFSADKTGLYYIDATSIPVCHPKRISSHKVFKDFAALGKTTMGWFYGFKLHLVINEKGDLMAAQLSPGNVDDRTPVRQIISHLQGLLFGDKGYIDQKIFQELLERGLKLVTGLRKNMINKMMILQEKILLRKRSIIETVNGVLKTDFQISHTRHRSPINGLVHICSTLLAFCLKPIKPRIKFSHLIPN